MSDEARRIPRLVRRLLGTRRGDDVLPARTRQRLALNHPPAEEARHVVVHRAGFAVADSAQILALATRATTFLVRDGHLDGVGDELLLEKRPLAPLLKALLGIDLLASAHLALDRRHLRRLLARATELLTTELRNLGLELVEIVLEVLRVAAPPALVVVARRCQPGGLIRSRRQCRSPFYAAARIWGRQRSGRRTRATSMPSSNIRRPVASISTAVPSALTGGIRNLPRSRRL